MRAPVMSPLPLILSLVSCADLSIPLATRCVELLMLPCALTVSFRTLSVRSRVRVLFISAP